MPTKHSSHILLTLTLVLLATVTSNAGWGRFDSMPAGVQTADRELEQSKTAGSAPTLGNYPTVGVNLSDNITITPDAPPTNSVSISVEAPASFTGQLTADPVTGIVRVTNAQPEMHTSVGIAITVRAFGANGASISKTFGLLVLPGPYCGQQSYFTAPSVPEIPAGSIPNSVAIGDFNNDDNQDVLTVNYSSNNVSIRLGNGSGGFTSPAVPEVVVGDRPLAVAIADFNGDGNQDIVVTNSFGPHQYGYTVSIRLGDGNGGFTLPAVPEIAAGSNTNAVAVGDFNRDGKADLAVGNFDTGIAIRLGDGAGGFVPSPAGDPTVIGVANSIAIGDFNRDGFQDIAATHSQNFVSIRLGNGVGGFTSPTTPEVSVGSIARSIAIGDFNRDRIQDFVTANTGTNTVSVRLGDGLGGFTSPATPEVAVAPQPFSIAIGDFNNDHYQDFAVSYNNSDKVSIRLGDDYGEFSSPAAPEITVGFRSNDVAIGDFNGDNIQDLTTANGSGSTSIRLGVCNAGTPTNTPTSTSTNTATASATSTPFNSIAVSLPSVTAQEGSTITVPITVGDLTGKGVISYDLQITFDPTVITPASTPYDRTGTLSGNLAITPNLQYPGHFIISAFSGASLTGSGTLLNLRFNIVGIAGQSTTLNFENYTDPGNGLHSGFLFNEGNPPAVTTNGSVAVSGSGSISGNISYGNAIGNPPSPRNISNVTLNASGSPPVSTVTNSNGLYSLSGLGLGSYTITLSKDGGVNGSITSFDAAKITQYVAGTNTLNTTQLLVSDVSGNSGISSLDAAMLAKFAAGPPYTGQGIGSTATWNFLPTARTYQLVGNVAGENYNALLMGDVSGNWTDSAPSRPTVNRNGPERSAAVAAPHLKSQADREILIPIKVQGAANKGIIAYEFDLRYDASVIRPQNDPVDLVNTVSRGLSVVVNPHEPGLLRVVVYGPIPIEENGLLLNLRFVPVGASGSVSPLTWERFMFNEGEPRVFATDGKVELF
ncbi:MAG: VCBS repeat-containing protein [Chloracidobacterium sp.]|nr:VCBS repeat-containing protein [Chloracidobacterium sp.]